MNKEDNNKHSINDVEEVKIKEDVDKLLNDVNSLRSKCNNISDKLKPAEDDVARIIRDHNNLNKENGMNMLRKMFIGLFAIIFTILVISFVIYWKNKDRTLKDIKGSIGTLKEKIQSREVQSNRSNEVASESEIKSQVGVEKLTEKDAKADEKVLVHNHDEEINLYGSPHAAIELSRDKNFATIYKHTRLNSHGVYRLPTLTKVGRIYWREKGSRKVQIIDVLPHGLHKLEVEFPKFINASKNLTWKTVGKATYFRIEVAAAPSSINRGEVYSTEEKYLPASRIGKGKWYIRVHAYEVSSGKWIHSKIQPVTIL